MVLYSAVELSVPILDLHPGSGISNCWDWVGKAVQRSTVPSTYPAPREPLVNSNHVVLDMC